MANGQSVTHMQYSDDMKTKAALKSSFNTRQFKFDMLNGWLLLLLVISVSYMHRTCTCSIL